MKKTFLFQTALFRYHLCKQLTQSAGAVENTNRTSAEGVRYPNEFPGYNTKPVMVSFQVMLDRWEMMSIPSLLSLPCLFRLGVVEPDRDLPMG